MRRTLRLLTPCLLLLAAGCAGLTRPDLAAMQRATRAAAAVMDPHLVLLKVERPAKEQPGSRVSTQFGSSGNETSVTMAGVLVTAEGHVLTTSLIEPAPDLRIRAFLGDREFRARIRGRDEPLGLTLLQITGGGPFTPLPDAPGAEPGAGDWLVLPLPTEEPHDFERHILVLNARGETPGHVRRFGVSGLYREARGAPVVNLDGRLVGLAGAGDVLLWNDIRADVAELVARSRSGTAEEAEEDGKAWLGTLLNTVNKDLARVRGWPAGCLRVGHVEPGSAGEKAGLRAGDLITGLNGKPLRFSGTRTREFFQQAMRPRVGRPFTLAVNRDGAELTLSGSLEKRPEPETLVVEELGVTVQAITAMDELELGLATRAGVRVTELQKGGAASNSGSMSRPLLMRHDVIVSVGGRPTPTLAAFREAAAALRRERPEAVAVQYWRGRLSGFAGLNLKSSQKAGGDAS